MKATVLAAATALAFVPALTSGAIAASGNDQAWNFTDYTPDPASLAADNVAHTATGTTITSYCHGSRVPSAPQDVTSRPLIVSAPVVLKLRLDTTGAWGVDVVRHGTSLAGITTTQTGGTAGALTVRLRPGRYAVHACNLGGAPTAQVGYRLVRAR
jgi:hypothetical protein